MSDPIGSETAYTRLRADIGANDAALPDTEAELLFVEADETYPNDSAKRTAYTRVLAIRRIRASAAMLGKYTQNQSSEDLTKAFDNLGKMLEEWKAEVMAAHDPVESSGGPFFFGVVRGQRGR